RVVDVQGEPDQQVILVERLDPRELALPRNNHIKLEGPVVPVIPRGLDLFLTEVFAELHNSIIYLDEGNLVRSGAANKAETNGVSGFTAFLGPCPEKKLQVAVVRAAILIEEM